VIAVSTQLATATAEYLRLPSEEVATILNPIGSVTGATRERDTLVHPWLLGRGIPTFVAMGRLEHQKGFDLLIDAFAQLSRDVSARLLIFGEGNLRAELQSRIDRYGLGDRILLPGYTPAPSAQMRAATAFVLSSRYEGFGLVLVEALAAGTRVIATDCDYGPAELLQGGRFGTLVPAGDPAALAAAMRGVLGDTPPPPRPDAAWFSQFDPVGVAQRHLALLD
jgi:glycosyltransferase involved in cell wall biosynthesis